MPWNDVAIIECHLAFKCPRTWRQLAPPNAEGIRVGGEGKSYRYWGKMGPEKVCRWGHRWDQA